MTDLLPLLEEFYRDQLTMFQRHQAAARLVGGYDANNTYQYIVNREDVQLTWVAKAIDELGGTLSDVPDGAREAKGKAAEAALAVFEEDGRDARTLADKWRPRIEAMNNARHAKMLRVILGEVLEFKRFFDQALAGRTDLLGKREMHLEPAAGKVLPTRWIE